jgi:hypothetical protein
MPNLAELGSANAYVLDPMTGYFISSEHQRIAELIAEYEPALRLVWIPPDQRMQNEEYPFAILHSPADRNPYIVRKVKQHEVNSELVAWLWMNDQARNGKAPLQRIKAIQDAEQALTMKRVEEQKAEMHDFASSVLRGKNYYKHNGKTYS